MRPKLHRFIADPTKITESILELNKHQDAVRLAFNDPRTHLVPVDKAREPLDGELLYSKDGSLFLCKGTEYVQLYPIKVSDLIPQWFLDYISILEWKLTQMGISESEWKYYGGM